MVLDRVFVHVSDNAGSMTAGAAGAVGAAGALTGQLPVPDGIPPWAWVLALGVGPSSAWFFSQLMAMFAAFAHERHLAQERRSVRLIEAGRLDDAEAALESSDRWVAWSAAARAAKKSRPKRDD